MAEHVADFVFLNVVVFDTEVSVFIFIVASQRSVTSNVIFYFA